MKSLYHQKSLDKNMVQGILFRIVRIIIILQLIFPNLLENVHGLQSEIQEITVNEKKELFPNKAPIIFWRTNSKILSIIESHVFPMASMGVDGSLSNLGKAWITWTIKAQNKKLAAWAIYNKGIVQNFTIIPGYYDEIYWNWIKEELFLITSSRTRTDFYWYSSSQQPLIDHYSLPFNSTNHQMFISSNQFLIFLYQNGSIPTNIEIEGISPVISITDKILISSTAGLGLFLLPNNSIELQSDEFTTMIPAEFSNRSRVGHILLEPAVFDIQTKKIWIHGSPFNEIYNLPDNTNAIYPFGLLSSIFQTTSNKLFEFSTSGFLEIDSFNSSYVIQDFAIIDIDLYIGTIPGNGLYLISSGTDEDGDFLPDNMEDYYATYPEKKDSDGDTIPDGLEIAFGTNPLLDDRFYDYDGDKLLNYDEFIANTDPLNHDSDYGGALDGWEINYNLDPLNSSDDYLDPDFDTVLNNIESIWNSNPFSIDSDNDTIPDNWEIKYRLDPTDPSNAKLDYDNDGKSNLQEYYDQTDPFVADPRILFDGLLIWLFVFSIFFTPINYLVWKKEILI